MASEYITGHCGMGHCEGTKPRSPSGQPFKTCDWWEKCNCPCHKVITRMFEDSELPRQIIENPEYVPVHVELPQLPATLEELPQVKLEESPDPTRVPGTVIREFGQTPTGRAARGELEFQVKVVCDTWLLERMQNPCTPQLISAEISRQHGIKPPSVGAISAVFDRWTALGFAMIEKKPTRFISYTPEGIVKGLEVMKMEAKANNKKAGRR